MKLENKKWRYIAAVVKPPHKDLGWRLNILFNKHGVEKHSKNYFHATTESDGLEE